MSDDGYFGAEIAATYDTDVSEMFDEGVVEPTVDFLGQLAGGGRALEFGVGTGRVAVPLVARGVEVHGIDMSAAMVARLRIKPGGVAVGTTIGDFATAGAPGEFSLVYLVFNTISNLTTQDAQVACFNNAARHLKPGGSFVIEVGVPALRLLPPGQQAVPFAVENDRWAYDWYDCATQAMSSNYVRQDGRFRSIPFRYVWPAELDLMARIAGLTLTQRWADWQRRPFEHESTRHVSVWQKPSLRDT
ncbi:class I SAM-dependent DNA methyltransferase [Mycobacterium montefiorense]|nr:class I SAM-dependent methyltransferase [Mycobacterium montefiorense]